MWKHTDCVEGELEFFLLLVVHLGLFFAFLVLCVLNRMNFEILAVCIFFVQIKISYCGVALSFIFILTRKCLNTESQL